MTRTDRPLLALWLVVVVGVAPLAAVTAVDASVAAAGNATPISSCTEISSSGSYELTSDLSGVREFSFNCISISADDVHLDGNGHVVEGDGGGRSPHSGVLASLSENVTVTNLTVTNYDVGVSYRSVTDGTISDVNASDNVGRGLLLARSVDGDTGSDRTVLADVTATGNDVYGVEVRNSDDVVVRTSTIDGESNSDRGIRARSSTGLTVEDTVVRGATGAQLALDASDGSGTNLTVGSGPTLDFDALNAMFDAASGPAPPSGTSLASERLAVGNLDAEWYANVTVAYDPSAVDESTVTLWRHDGSWQSVSGATTDQSADAVTANVTTTGTYAAIGDATGSDSGTTGSGGDGQPADDTPPDAVTGPDRRVPTGTLVVFDGSNSTDNRGIESYRWSLHRPNQPAHIGRTLQRVYGQPGEYVAELTVTDAAGNADSELVNLTVYEPTATLDTGPDGDITVDTGAGQAFTGTTNVPPGTTLEYQARSVGNNPFLKPGRTTVRSNGTFAFEESFSDVPNGTEFTVTVLWNDELTSEDGIAITGSGAETPADGTTTEPAPTTTSEPTTPTPTPTPTSTSTSSPTSSPEPTTTEAADQDDDRSSGPTTTTDGDGGSWAPAPGFTPVAVLVAVSLLAIIATRRD